MDLCDLEEGLNIQWIHTNCCYVFTAFTKQEFDWVLSRVVPGSVYIGLGTLALIVLEAVTVSIVDAPGTFSKISTVLSTLFYTAVAAFIFGISIVSVALYSVESQCNPLKTKRICFI
jgi:hypothetical protein